jgi:hypothetical protein
MSFGIRVRRRAFSGSFTKLTRWPKYSAAFEKNNRAIKIIKHREYWKKKIDLLGENMKLIDHRMNLAKNGDAFTYDIFRTPERTIKTLIPHLKAAGHVNITFTKHYDLLKEIILLLFEAQDYTPFFHIEGTELPLCWNRPSDWDINYVKYEWGHIHSINRNKEIAFSIKNLGLYSARCNQHIQSSMDVQELMVYGGVLANRITTVLTKRRFLFNSEKWITIEKVLKTG